MANQLTDLLSGREFPQHDRHRELHFRIIPAPVRTEGHEATVARQGQSVLDEAGTQAAQLFARVRIPQRDGPLVIAGNECATQRVPDDSCVARGYRRGAELADLLAGRRLEDPQTVLA